MLCDYVKSIKCVPVKCLTVSVKCWVFITFTFSIYILHIRSVTNVRICSVLSGEGDHKTRCKWRTKDFRCVAPSLLFPTPSLPNSLLTVVMRAWKWELTVYSSEDFKMKSSKVGLILFQEMERNGIKMDNK